MFERYEQTIFEIKETLLQDEIIRKLVGNSSNNALNKPTPSLEQCDDYILPYEIFEFEDRDNLDKNVMINITINSFETGLDTQMTAADIYINLVANKNCMLLSGKKLRLMQLANRIIYLLDNTKFSISNLISFVSMDKLIINKKITGYYLVFSAIDGNAEIDN